jgi:hypothetical protein
MWIPPNDFLALTSGQRAALVDASQHAAKKR